MQHSSTSTVAACFNWINTGDYCWVWFVIFHIYFVVLNVWLPSKWRSYSIPARVCFILFINISRASSVHSVRLHLIVLRIFNDIMNRFMSMDLVIRMSQTMSGKVVHIQRPHKLIVLFALCSNLWQDARP